MGPILSRETYNGVLKIGDVVNELPELRIVGKKTFERVEELRKEGRKCRPGRRTRPVAVEVERLCGNCMAMVLPGMRFCPTCGIEQEDLGAIGYSKRQTLQ